MLLLLPADMVALLAPFALLFSQPVWRRVHVLLAGAILTPGQRTVSSALRAIGLSHLPTFQAYHRVLNRAVWSSRGASRILLHVLLATFAPAGPLVLGIDETIERRRGKQIAAAGIYMDPVRSSHSHFVKVRGLRWICLMLLVPVPWATRMWALPFLTVLAPSERVAQRGGRRFNPLTTWARQMMRQVHRWQPARSLVVVGDRTYAALELLDAVRSVVTVVTRLSRCSPRRRSGTRRASRRCRSAGCSSAIPAAASALKRCCAPIWTPRRCRSSPGSSAAGSCR